MRYLFLLLALLAPLVGTAQTVPGAVDPESRAISVVVNPSLRHTRQLPTRSLRAARQSMIAGREVSDANLARLGEHNDGLAAWRYVKRLLARDPVAHASDIAFYSAVAAGTGRGYALDDMIAAMHHLDPVEEPWTRRTRLIRVLYAHAWAGNTMAMDAVIAFNGEGTLFGPMSQRTLDRVLRAAERGDGRIELQLAMKLLNATGATRSDLETAMGYLNTAVASPDLTISPTSKNLIPLLVGRLAADVASN